MFITPIQTNVNRQFLNRKSGSNSGAYNRQNYLSGGDKVSFEGSAFRKYNPTYNFCLNLFKRSQLASRRRFSAPIDELNGIMNEVSINLKGRGKIVAYDINPKNLDRYIIFFHGASQNITNTQSAYKQILNSDFAVLAPEYTGFGKNKPAKTDEFTLMKDIDGVLKYLNTNKNIKPENIGIVGHSLGGFAALLAAEKSEKSPFVVLISPLNSLYFEVDTILTNSKFKVPKFVKFIYKKFPSILKTLDRIFKSEERVANCKVPLYILHSLNDKLIPVESSINLASKAKNLKELIILQTGGHELGTAKLNTLSDIISKMNK